VNSLFRRTKVPNGIETSKALTSLAATIVAAAIALSSATASASDTVAVAPIENRAGLTTDEVGVLTSTVVSALTSAGAGVEVVPLVIDAVGACDASCVEFKAKESDARYVVTGAAVLFGGQYTVTIEATDLASGKIVASANTPAVATLTELLSSLQGTASKLRDDLLPNPTPTPIPYPPAPQAWTTASPPAPAPHYNSTPKPTGNAGVLVITTDPPGAEVTLKSSGGEPITSAGLIGLALSSGEESSFMGVTPMSKSLQQGKYKLEIERDGYDPVYKTATVYIGETTRLNVKLEEGKPLLVGGTAMMCGGTVVALSGAILFVARGKKNGELSTSETGSVVLAVVGGAMMIGGVTMWVLHGVRKASKKSQRSGFALLPTPDLVAMGYAQTF
jgi:hypothetical protein